MFPLWVCCECCRDEANDDVKSSILVAIGSWLKFTTTLSPSVSTRLADCLKEKDALKSAALKATLQVSFPDSAQCAVPHSQHLLAIYNYCCLRQQTSNCFLADRVFDAHSMQTTYSSQQLLHKHERKMKVCQHWV